MRCFLLLAAVLTFQSLPPYARAEDDEEPAEAPAEAPDEVQAPPAPPSGQTGARTGAKDRAPGSGSVASGGGGGASSGGAGGSGSGGSPGAKNCRVYEDIRAMPHGANGAYQVAHGVLSFTGPGQCIAVGFVIKEPKNFGWCVSAESPLSPTDDACTFTYSISKTPGGAPVSAACKVGPLNSRGGNLNFAGADPKAKLPPKGCALPPGRYFCTITAGGFNHPEQPAKRCGGLLASPMMQNPQGP